MIRGCDVSKWQGLVDWKSKVLEGYNFGYAKATDVSTITHQPFVDVEFRNNEKNIPDSGAFGGAYMFVQPQYDAKMQAKFFCDTVTKNSPLRLQPMIDIEKTGGERISTVISQLQIICDYLEQYFGVTPFLYSYLAFFKQLNLPASFAKYPLWLAEYNTAPGVVPTSVPVAPHPFTVTTIYQYAADNGLDKDLFNGDMATLEKFLMK